MGKKRKEPFNPMWGVRVGVGRWTGMMVKRPAAREATPKGNVTHGLLQGH